LPPHRAEDGGRLLKIWLSGTPAPIALQFNKKLSIDAVQSGLASYVLR